MAGYHVRKITKGTYGEVSKIYEEFEEFLDAYEQNNQIMQLLELSDIYGAIEAYVMQHNMTMDDIKAMSDATKSAFLSGERK